jgi:GT2 family glycosyltransferase
MAMVDGSGESHLKPVCSVCIANFNGERIICDAIQSVYDQDCAFPVEIIVHDDASTDRSVELIRRWYPHVTLLESEHNTGYCISNNRMVARASGQYVLLLNNDATLLPNALSTLHRRALQEEKPAILGLPQYDAATGDLIDYGALLDPFLNPIPNKDRRRDKVAMVIGACLWIPRRVWDDLGGFPEFFGSNAEDMYLCCCARLRGYQVGIAQDSAFMHQVGNTLGGGKVMMKRLSTTYRRRALSERNKSFVLTMTYPSPWVYAILPCHLLLLVLEGLLLAVVKRNGEVWKRIYWPCLTSIIQNRTELVHRRLRIQQARRISSFRFFSQFRAIPHKSRMLLKYGVPAIG